MKLSEIFSHAIKSGARCDPRKKGVKGYADSAILYGNPDQEVKKILVGIDIDAGELLVADKIKNSRGLDLVLSHHPQGAAWAGFYDVMKLQVDIFSAAGLLRSCSERFVNARKKEVERKVSAHNHMRAVDIARILNIAFACLHTPADNHAAFFIRDFLTKRRPRQLKDAVEALSEIPEYRLAQARKSGPKIILGHPNRKLGRFFTEMTGGTEGPKGMLPALYKKGFRTLVSMHLSEEYFAKARDCGLSVIVAGHISSDSLGLNLLLDSVERASKQRFEIIECSGFTRIRRH